MYLHQHSGENISKVAVFLSLSFCSYLNWQLSLNVWFFSKSRNLYITVISSNIYLEQQGYLIKYNYDLQNWEEYHMDTFWPGNILMSKAQNIHWFLWVGLKAVAETYFMLLSNYRFYNNFKWKFVLLPYKRRFQNLPSIWVWKIQIVRRNWVFWYQEDKRKSLRFTALQNYTLLQKILLVFWTLNTVKNWFYNFTIKFCLKCKWDKWSHSHCYFRIF